MKSQFQGEGGGNGSRFTWIFRIGKEHDRDDLVADLIIYLLA